MNAKIHIGVLGPNQCTEEQYQSGVQVGAEIARQGAILVCGGLGGMMAAAAEGAKSQNGNTVGILPGDHKKDANPYIDIPIPTGLGAFRNTLVVRACDAVVAIHGAYGTLSEIAFALRLGIPVVGLHTWELFREGEKDSGIIEAESAVEAVQKAMAMLSTD